MQNIEKPSSRNMPDPIQREIRQRCGFGCVICGLPLFEYEHMEGWASVQRHIAEEITLLCDQHHREKTGGLLPVEVVREADKNPFNLQTGVSKPYNLHYSGDECYVEIGSNIFTTKVQGYNSFMLPIVIDGLPILAFIFSDGHLLLNLNLFDEFNNQILSIGNNQLLYSVSPWDIQLVGRNLVIREATRKILVDIIFEVPNKIIINRARFLLNGVELLVYPDYVLLTNNRQMFSNGKTTNVPYGFVFGNNSLMPGPGLIYSGGIPRYLGDRSEAIKWAKKNFREMNPQD